LRESVTSRSLHPVTESSGPLGGAKLELIECQGSTFFR
jgi:hypothetical protein